MPVENSGIMAAGLVEGLLAIAAGMAHTWVK
jgi:hypothetical protein